MVDIYRTAQPWQAPALAGPPPIDDDDHLVAGRLLALAMRWRGSAFRPDPRRTIAQYAETLAKVTAARGTEFARGWLDGLWYVSGNEPVIELGHRVDDLTYHGIVYALQGFLSMAIVTAPWLDETDDPEETAAHDADIEARHAAYHGEVR